MEAYRLVPGLALRREPFGGIAYSYADRRLRMVRSPAAVDVALRLDAGERPEDLAADYGARTERLIDALVAAEVIRGRDDV